MKRVPLRVAVSVRKRGKSLSVRTKACNGRATKTSTKRIQVK